MRWPAHATANRLSAKASLKVKKAFQDCLNGEQIAQAWAETHPAGGSVSPQMARDWAQIHAHTNKKPMQSALAQIYATGYVLGETAATYMYAHLTGFKKAPSTKDMARASVVDWNTWEPGNRAAAAILKPKGGLEGLLASRKITIADDVISTKLDRIGTALSKSLAAGETASDAAKRIDSIIDDPEHALVIAQTEMSRAVSVASRDLYESSNVEQVEWLVAEGCDDCQENADASPISIDDTFPSGDSEPPAHPNCMCSLAPYVVSDTGEDISEDIELAVKPDLVKFVPSKMEVERAKSRLKILPNPPHVPDGKNPDKLVEIAWQYIEPITVNPNVWDKAELALIELKDLTATDAYLRRKKLKEHIESMGQAMTPYRSYALVVERDGELIIIDGHHRLMAMWLLGQETAPVWLASV